MSAPATSPATGAMTPNLESRIHAVTVYKSGARVTRIADLPAEASSSGAVRFSNLPLSLVDSTLRCRLLGGAGLRATDLQCALRLPEAEEVVADSLEEELRAVRLEVARLRARFAFVEESIALRLTLGERGKPEPGAAPQKSPLRARMQTLETLNARLEGLHEERDGISEELRVAENRQCEIDTQLLAASSNRNSRVEGLRKSVVVGLQGSGSASAQIEIEYFVPGACWAPSYALRLAATLTGGEMAMRAMVSQRSGEDWRGVKLTLSTADHQQWAELPELNSKRIGRRQASPPKKGWRPPPIGTELLYRDYDASFGGPSASPISTFGGRVQRPVSMPMPAPPAPPASLAAELAYDAYDDDEEFEGKSTQVMESAAGAYSNQELDEMPAPMAAMAPQMASRMASPGAPPSKKRSKARPERQRAMAVGGRSGASAAAADLVPSQTPTVDLDLMQYARLRMEPPSNSRRGTLHVVSRMEVYAELFAETGAQFDGATQQVLARADSRANDIAALPTGHTQPWSEGFDYAYRCANSVDLDSDGQFHSVPVVSGSAGCCPLYVVVPRESTDVFRTVVVSNPLDAPLLAGPMDVYWDDTFLLTSSVAFTAPKGKVELGLGVDQSIKVVRNTHFREDTAGLMGGSLSLSHKIVVQLANEGKREIQLEVRERIPVPATDEDDVKLEIKSVTPAWNKFEPPIASAQSEAPKGMYRWQLSLAAAERVELTAMYEIAMPSKYELRGGNRREW
tara:strand:+ start:110297 stop:112519 length:2223 start_codon:yes stop_codon:yes gene_type:complete